MVADEFIKISSKPQSQYSISRGPVGNPDLKKFSGNDGCFGIELTEGVLDVLASENWDCSSPTPKVLREAVQLSKFLARAMSLFVNAVTDRVA